MGGGRNAPLILIVCAVLGLFFTMRFTQNNLITFHRKLNNQSGAGDMLSSSSSPSDMSAPEWPPYNEEENNPDEIGLPSSHDLATPHPAAWRNKSDLSPWPISYPAQYVFVATAPYLDARAHIVTQPPAEVEARTAFRRRFSKKRPQMAAAADRRLAVAAARNNWMDSRSAAQCGEQMRDGKYWRYTEHECVDVEGFFAPLRSYEAGIDELTCSAPQMRKAWKVALFEKVSNATDVDAIVPTVTGLAPRFVGVSDPNQRAAIQAQYGRYIFYSSWLFRQYRPWRPMPIATSALQERFADPTTTAGAFANSNNATTIVPVPKEQQQQLMLQSQPPQQAQQLPAPGLRLPPTSVNFRAFVDDNTEKLMRVENFCISPIIGFMSGYGPDADVRARSYQNDDTRGAHNEPQYREFFNRVRTRLKPPTFFDERPVVFFSAMFLSSHNMAHSHFKFWGLLGVLKLNPFSESLLTGQKPPPRTAESQPDPNGPRMAEGEDATSAETAPTLPEQLKPLIVLVLRYDGKERFRARAFGFMLQMLDLPWAVQLADPHDGPDVDAMMKRGRHGVPAGPSGWVANKVATVMKTIKTKECRNETQSQQGGGSAPPIVKEICEDKTRIEWAADVSEPDEMCFRRGIAWQNCFHTDCTELIHGDRPASFDFYNYQPINTWRRWMMARYESLLNRCLPVETAVPPVDASPLLISAAESGSALKATTALAPPPEAATGTTTPAGPLVIRDDGPALFGAPTPAPPPLPTFPPATEFRRPKILFNIRTASRSAWFTNLLMDWVRTELVQMGFASDVIFRELWKGSRGQYLDDIRTSDVFAGVHGGSFAITMMLRPKPVVVEYAASWSFCQPHQGPNGPYCWFDAQSTFKDGSHWVYEFPFSMWDGVFRLGSYAVMDSLKEASCRWYLQQFGFGISNASLVATELLHHRNASTVLPDVAGRFKPMFSGSRDPALANNPPNQQQQKEEANNYSAAQQTSFNLDRRIPKYCRNPEAVKYADMSRLHVQLGNREVIDAREAQHLLQRFFQLEISFESATLLLRALAPLAGKLSWYLESHAFDIFTLLLAHFHDARLQVYNRTRRLEDDPRRLMSVRYSPHKEFEYPLQRVACLRAVSPFFSPGIAVPPGKKETIAAANESSSHANATSAFSSSSSSSSEPPSPPTSAPPHHPDTPVLGTYIPDDFDPHGEESADTTCLFAAHIGPHPPPPNAPTLVAPLPNITDPPATTAPSAKPDVGSAGAGADQKQQRANDKAARRARRAARAIQAATVDRNAAKERSAGRIQGLFIGLGMVTFIGGIIGCIVMRSNTADDPRLELPRQQQQQPRKPQGDEAATDDGGERTNRKMPLQKKAVAPPPKRAANTVAVEQGERAPLVVTKASLAATDAREKLV